MKSMVCFFQWTLCVVHYALWPSHCLLLTLHMNFLEPRPSRSPPIARSPPQTNSRTFGINHSDTEIDTYSAHDSGTQSPTSSFSLTFFCWQKCRMHLTNTEEELSQAETRARSDVDEGRSGNAHGLEVRICCTFVICDMNTGMHVCVGWLYGTYCTHSTGTIRSRSMSVPVRPRRYS